MMEVLLNILWALIALTSSTAVLWRTRDWKRVTAVLFVVALLFPIVSASDDLVCADRTLEVAVAVLAFFVLSIGLVAIARIYGDDERIAGFELLPLTDPRSPPRV